MRRSEKEILDPAIIEEILKSSEICRIAITDHDVPYVVPLNYGYSDGILYFHSSSVGRKIDLLRKNNKVAFEIEFAAEIIRDSSPCKWTTRYRSVMGTGTIEIIDDTEGIINGLNMIMTHYGNNQNSYETAYFKRIVILKLHIDQISGKQSGEWGVV